MENYKKSDVTQYIQTVDMDIMISLKNVLEQHGLKYFLIAGSVLGAVRHEGFIPWDDDVDFGMPRKDYEQFIQNMNKWLPEGFHAENYHTNDSYKYYITRVYNDNAPIKELRGEGGGTATNVSIDIFPFDGTPENKIVRLFFIKQIMVWRMLASFANRNNIDTKRSRGLIEKLLINVANLIRIDRFVNSSTFYQIIDKKLKKYKYEESKYVGSLMGAYREKEIVQRTWIEPLKTYKFENQEFLGPGDFDSYLTHMYGDYLKVPPYEKIIEKKHFELLDKSDYKEQLE